MRKLTFEYVRQYFKDNGCELISEEYINARGLLKYKCSCNNISNIRFDNFRSGQRCRKCINYSITSIEYIQKYFKDND
jgi:hypothetical protein